MIAWIAASVKHTEDSKRMSGKKYNSRIMHLASVDCSRFSGKSHSSNYLKNVILFGDQIVKHSVWLFPIRFFSRSDFSSKINRG